MKSRRQIEDDTRRAHIMGVAEALFAEKGLQNASVADIAKAAEFGVGTIYKYFKDKGSLIEELLELRTTAHFDMLDNSLQGDDPPPVIVERFIETYFLSLQERLLFFRIYFTNFHPGPGTSIDSSEMNFNCLDERKMAMFQRLDEVFTQGIENGQFADVAEPSYLSSALWGMLISFYFLAEFKLDGQVNVQELKTALMNILFKQVLLTSENAQGLQK